MSSLGYNKFLLKQHFKKLSFVKSTYFFQHGGMFIVAVIVIMAFPITVALTNKNPNNRIASFFRVTNTVCSGDGNCVDYSGAGGAGADQAMQGIGVIGNPYNVNNSQNSALNQQLNSNNPTYNQPVVQPGVQSGLNPADSNPASIYSASCYQAGNPCYGMTPPTTPAGGNTNTGGTTNVQQPVTYCAGGTNTQTCYQTGNSCTCTANAYLPSGMVPYNGSQDTYNPNAINPDGSVGKWIDSGTAGNPIVGVTPVIYSNNGGGYLIAPTIPAAQARPIATAPTAVPTLYKTEMTVLPPTAVPANNNQAAAPAKAVSPTPIALITPQGCNSSNPNAANPDGTDPCSRALSPGFYTDQIEDANVQIHDTEVKLLDVQKKLKAVSPAKGAATGYVENLQAQEKSLNDQITFWTDKVNALSSASESDSITSAPAAVQTGCTPVTNGIGGLQINLSQGYCDPSISTPAPSSYALLGPTVNVAFSVPGVGNNTSTGQNAYPSQSTLKAFFDIQNPDGKSIRKVSMNLPFDSSTGTYSGVVPVGGNLSSGKYKILMRSDNSLWKNVGNINLSPATNSDVPNTNLVSGDTNQDNRLDLSDYTAIITCITKKSCTAGNIADLNQDGKFDEADLNILYSNFKTRQGD